MTDNRALMRYVAETQPGTTVALGVMRAGSQQILPVSIGAMPANQSYKTFLDPPGVPKPKLPQEATTNFGLQMAAVTPELRRQYQLDGQQEGVLITGVAIGSAAANNRINAGSVILQVRGTRVTSPDDVTNTVEKDRGNREASVPIMLSEPAGLRWAQLPLS